MKRIILADNKGNIMKRTFIAPFSELNSRGDTGVQKAAKAGMGGGKKEKVLGKKREAVLGK